MCKRCLPFETNGTDKSLPTIQLLTAPRGQGRWTRLGPFDTALGKDCELTNPAHDQSLLFTAHLAPGLSVSAGGKIKPYQQTALTPDAGSLSGTGACESHTSHSRLPSDRTVSSGSCCLLLTPPTCVRGSVCVRMCVNACVRERKTETEMERAGKQETEEEERQRGEEKDPGGRILKTVTISEITEIMGYLFHKRSWTQQSGEETLKR